MFRRLGVVLPYLPARLDIDPMNDAPTGHKIERAVDFQRSADRIARRQIDEPSETEPRDILGIDLCQRAVMLLAVCAARPGPSDAGTVVAQPGVIRLNRRSGRAADGKKPERKQGSHDRRTVRHGVSQAKNTINKPQDRCCGLDSWCGLLDLSRTSESQRSPISPPRNNFRCSGVP